MKTQINFRASAHTSAQIKGLVEATGLNQTEIIAIAIDRMAREETMNSVNLHMIDCRYCGQSYNSGKGNIHLCWTHELAELDQTPEVIAHTKWVRDFERRHPNWPNRIAWDTD